MKKILSMLLTFAILASSLFWAGGTTVSAQNEVNKVILSSKYSYYYTGDTFSVDILGQNADDMFGVEFILTYDNSALRIVDDLAAVNDYEVLAKDSMVSGTRSQTKYAIVSSKLETGSHSSIKLGTIKFRSLKSGTTSIELSNIMVLGSDESLQPTNTSTTHSISLSFSTRPASNPEPETPASKPEVSEGKVEVTPVVGTDGSAKVSLDKETMDKLIETTEADSEGIKTVSIKVKSVEGASSYAQTLPASSMKALGGEDRISINTPVANITLPGNMFDEDELGKAEEIGIKVAAADISGLDETLKKSIGDKPVIEINAIIDGKIAPWENKKAPVTIELDYTPTEEELKDPEHIVVWYIDGEGYVQAVPNGRYNPETGKVVFTVTHFSKYAIAYSVKTFADIAGYKGEAKKAVEVMASKGVISGKTGNLFLPEEAITRADYLIYLLNCLGLTAEFDSNFTDVKPGDYYYEAVGIAKELGITNGNGKNEFKPNKTISRQDMMVMTVRALRLVTDIPSVSEADLAKFVDAGKIASYARNDVAVMAKMGIIKGTNNRMNPQQIFPRIQSAMVVYRIYNLEK